MRQQNGDLMRTLVVTTERGSTYVVGATADGERVRVARMSGHVVRGTAGPTTFVDDFSHVELVPTLGGLSLECTTIDGQRFRTSTVVAVRDADVPQQASA